MLWDLGLKVGHATRSLGECVRLAKQDITIRTALLEARYLWGDMSALRRIAQTLLGGSGDRQRARISSTAKLAERDERHERQGESRYLVEPNIKEGKGGLRDLQTLYWIGKYLYHVDDAADLVEHNVFTARRIQDLPEGRGLSVGRARAVSIIWWAAPEERLSFDVQPGLAADGWVIADDEPAPRRRAIHARLFSRRQGCGRSDAHLLRGAGRAESQGAAPNLSRLLPGFLKPRTGNEDFYVENGRLDARPDVVPPRSRQYPAHFPYRR